MRINVASRVLSNIYDVLSIAFFPSSLILSEERRRYLTKGRLLQCFRQKDWAIKRSARSRVYRLAKSLKYLSVFQSLMRL